jgi:hypothetical protein
MNEESSLCLRYEERVITKKCAEIHSVRRRGQEHRRGESVVEGHDDAVL